MNRMRCSYLPRLSYLGMFLAIVAPAGLATDGPTAATQAWLEKTREDFHFPGMAVAVAHEGKLVFQGQAGLADVAHQVPAGPQTLFRIGSLSKLLTVALAAKMAEEGTLHWESPVRDVLGDLVTWEKSPLLWQLAAHTAGVRHYRATDFQDCQRYLTALGQGRPFYSSLRDGLTIFIADPLLFEPGTSYSYSSYGYNLLGVVLEELGNAPFQTLMASKVCDPLGMTATRDDQPYEIVANRTGFYLIGEDGSWRGARLFDSSYKWPSGGMLSTPADLVRLGLAYLEPGWLSRQTLDQVFLPRPNAVQDDFAVGLGWRIAKDRQGRTIYHHGGAMDGARGFLLLYPQSKTVVAVLANAFAPLGLGQAEELAAFFMGKQPEPRH